MCESVSKQQKISEWLLFLFYETRFGTYQPIYTSSTNREYQGDSDGVTRYHRQQFQPAQEDEDRWLTIVLHP